MWLCDHRRYKGFACRPGGERPSHSSPGAQPPHRSLQKEVQTLRAPCWSRFSHVCIPGSEAPPSQVYLRTRAEVLLRPPFLLRFLWGWEVGVEGKQVKTLPHSDAVSSSIYSWPFRLTLPHLKVHETEVFCLGAPSTAPPPTFTLTDPGWCAFPRGE